MEPINRHPLESITRNSGLSMLELLIPFVDYPLKLPLALFIKLNEIRLIINAFHSIETIARLGLHNTSSKPVDMLSSLTGISPEVLQMLMSLSDGMNDSLSSDLLSGLTGKSSVEFSNLANMIQQMNPTNSTGSANTDFPFTSETTPSDTQAASENFERNIQNILAEYDMLQAAQLNQDAPNTEEDSPLASTK